MYAAVDQLVMREEFSVTGVCDVLQVSRSGFVAWQSQQTTRREQRDTELTPMIQDIFWHHRRRYGARRIAALSRGIRARQPGAGLIHHSNRGGQFASRKYRAMLRCGGIVQSMSAAGNCYDNAFMESCFGTIKTELQLVDYADDPMAVRELSEYIRYDNFERRHSAIGYDTPIEFERSHAPGNSQTP